MIDINEFKNPSKQYRAKPFWALNGKLKKQELKKQIENMKMMGFGGAFLHSRTGLKTEYMGKEWLDLMEYCVDVLKENDMEAYLYDEDRWPSGTCGGYVTMNPEFRAKSMASLKIENESQKLPETLLGIFAIVLGKNKKVKTFRKVNNFTECNEKELCYAFYWQEMAKDTFYNGYTYIDTMYKPACEKFLELTHEKYKEKFGERFGKDIIGIFTDEPQRGPVFCGFSRKETNKEDEVPYTPALFEEFEKRKGYKLEDNLPLIWFGDEESPFVKVTYDYLEVVNQLFLENFAKPYHDWCVKNNLKLTGHILHEDNLASQTTMSGSMMRYYEYMDYPGMDNLGTQNYLYHVPAMLSSACKQLGKEYALDELYGCSGWEMNLKDYKQIGDWQSAGGVTIRCPHLSWYTMEGEAKRDCPASIFHQSAWYTEYHVLEDYFSRLTYLFKNSRDMVSTAIIHPNESTWGLSNKYTYCNFFDVKDPLYKKLETEYNDLYNGLRLNGQQIDYIDEGLFFKYGKVVDKEFICGQKSYNKIILNSNLNLRKSTLKALKTFLSNGGKVYIVGDLPQYLDGDKHDFSKDLSLAEKLPFDINLVVEKIKDDFVYTNSSNIIATTKMFGNDVLSYFINQSNDVVNAEIKIKTEKVPFVLNARDGEIKSIPFTKKGDYVVINKKLCQYEEIILYLTSEIKLEMEEEYEYSYLKTIKEFNYELEEENMLVLDNPKFYIDNVYFGKKFIVFVDQDIRRNFGLQIRHNEMIQPWFKEKFFDCQDKKYCVVKLEYEFKVENIPSKLEYMYESIPSMKIELNDNEIDLSNLSGSKIDNCFKVVDLPSIFLKEGKNILSISFDFYEKTDIEGGFLLGDFGVKLGEIDSLIKLPEKLNNGDLVKQGLPYYGGRIKLVDDLENGDYKITTDEMNVAVETINGEILAFRPYEADFSVLNGKIEIEAVLNRKNCFGVMAIDDKREGIIKQNFGEFKIYEKKKV